MRFDGRVALITGAGRGIGREYALMLAARGACVVVNDLGVAMSGDGADSSAPADDVVTAICSAGGSAAANYDSVAEPDGVERMVAQAVDTFGRIDILINNAGIVRFRPFTESTSEGLRQVLNVHVMGTTMTCRAVWPHFIRRGYGRVVNTVSGGIFGSPMLTEYTAAKGAIFAFTRSLAAECTEPGIRVNAIAPGAATRMLLDADIPQDIKERSIQDMPAALIAPGAAFLAHESCELSGETLSLQGGHVRRISLAENVGIFDRELTAETIRDRLPEILDEATAAHWGDTFSITRARMSES